MRISKNDLRVWFVVVVFVVRFIPRKVYIFLLHHTLFFLKQNRVTHLFFLFIFMYLFMAVLGLRFCARAFSSCGKRGPLFIAVRRPLTIAASTSCRAQAPDAQAQ